MITIISTRHALCESSHVIWSNCSSRDCLQFSFRSHTVFKHKKKWVFTLSYLHLFDHRVISVYLQQLVVHALMLHVFLSKHTVTHCVSLCCVCAVVSAGQCECKEGFTGRQCDRCAFGYRDFPQCSRCECNLSGSINTDPCSPCICKVSTVTPDCPMVT